MLTFDFKIPELNDSTLDTKLKVQDRQSSDLGEAEVSKNEEGLYVYDMRLTLSGQPVHVVGTSRSLDSSGTIEYDSAKTTTPARIVSFRR